MGKIDDIEENLARVYEARVLVVNGFVEGVLIG